VAVLVTVLAVPVAAAHAGVTPPSAGPDSAFEVTFPAQAVGLDLQLTGPRACSPLDDLFIAIPRARRGHFRFGPRVPGARPRRNGKRLRRWCRGSYHLSVVASDQFEPSPADVVARSAFTVR
jgi:hypothetical protein